MVRIFTIFFVFFTLSCFAEQGGAQRVWTFKNKKTLEARLHGTTSKRGETIVVLAHKKNSLKRFKLNEFSLGDQKFILSEGWEYPKPWLGWPNSLLVTLADTKTKKLKDETFEYCYASKNFLIKSEHSISNNLLNRMARTLEGVYLLLESSPWGILGSPNQATGRFDVIILKSNHSYIINGGILGSAACYIRHRNAIMMPYSSLLDLQDKKRFDDNCLVHEVTHMLMSDILDYIPIWLIEGTAQYMELIEVRTSMFRPRSIKQRLLDHNKSMIGTVKRGRPVPLKAVFGSTQEHWQKVQQKSGKSPSSINGYYHSSLLLTYYFMHLDGFGKAERLTRFTNAALSNSHKLYRISNAIDQYEHDWLEFVSRPEVTQDANGKYSFPATLRPPKQPEIPPIKGNEHTNKIAEYAVLLDGRSEKQLIKDATAALKKIGVKFQ